MYPVTGTVLYACGIMSNAEYISSKNLRGSHGIRDQPRRQRKASWKLFMNVCNMNFPLLQVL